jgi:hypothetical protein
VDSSPLYCVVAPDFLVIYSTYDILARGLKRKHLIKNEIHTIDDEDLDQVIFCSKIEIFAQNRL